MGDNKVEGVATKGWKQVIEKWHERRGEHAGTVLLLNHPHQVDVTMVDAHTGRWQVTVPTTALADAMVALLARGGNHIDIIAMGTSAPPIPRDPNPPPPPGEPVLGQVIRAVSAVRLELQLEAVQAAVEKMNAAGTY